MQISKNFLIFIFSGMQLFFIFSSFRFSLLSSTFIRNSILKRERREESNKTTIERLLAKEIEQKRTINDYGSIFIIFHVFVAYLRWVLITYLQSTQLESPTLLHFFFFLHSFTMFLSFLLIFFFLPKSNNFVGCCGDLI